MQGSALRIIKTEKKVSRLSHQNLKVTFPPRHRCRNQKTPDQIQAMIFIVWNLRKNLVVNSCQY